MGNDWVPESQVTKNNCAVQRINRFLAPAISLPSITWVPDILCHPLLSPQPMLSSLVFIDRRSGPQSSFIKLVALNLLSYHQWHGAD